MHVLLLRPVPGNDRFGLGPFFRIEPLGMEYIAAALEARGHVVTLDDLRFSMPIGRRLRTSRPGLVGIAAMHALETDEVLDLARRVRQLAPDVPIVVGGHTASAYPTPFLTGPVDAVVLDDGERAVPRVADVLERGGRLADVPGLACGSGSGEAIVTGSDPETFELDDVPLPARRHVGRWRKQYACLAHRPTWLIETARAARPAVPSVRSGSFTREPSGNVRWTPSAGISPRPAATSSWRTTCSGITPRAAWRSRGS